jgi:hypothetical protein
MHTRSLIRSGAILLTLSAIGPIAHSIRAQAVSPPARIPIPYTSYIGINPLGIPFDIFSVEVESGIAQGMTLGGNASHTEIDDKRYSSGDFKFRYYPSEIVLKGFSIGASAGLLRYSDIDGNGLRQTIDSPTVGLLLDYNWMLGATQRFIVGTGIAAKRILAGSEDRAKVDLDRQTFSVRFTIGVAF